MGQLQISPFSIKNVRRFIAFRALFNARFYYPVFTVLFLDFGLTLSQFALLNVVWAATIVCLEVPSGALADTLGRRTLLVFSGALMVVEMALLCFVPTGSPGLLFGAFLLNRVLSGTAEAAASGADEALAYDSLKRWGNSKDWGRVLEMQVRVQSMTFVAVMTLGAAVYDPVLVGRVASRLGLQVLVTQETTLRFPLYLTLSMALLTFLTTLSMREERLHEPESCPEPGTCGSSIIQAFRLTLEAGRWILQTPFALLVILAGLLFDHTIRMLITLNSQYYRVIGLPEATFGLIGSGMALLGIFVPRLARKLAESSSPAFNMNLLAALTLLGLFGMTFVFPLWGVLPVVVLMGVMYGSHFFVSHYLNEMTESHQRATVLSFKGLSFNFAYGMIGVMYSLLLAGLRARAEVPHDPQTPGQLEDWVFVRSLAWFPWYFVILLAALLAYSAWRLRVSPGATRPRTRGD